MPISRSAQRQGFISLFGEDGDDLLQGGAGNDALRGGQGTDAIDGEAGEDRFSEQGNTNIVINGFVVTSTLLGTDTAQNIERFELTGGSGANLLDARLSSLPVMLSGGTGNDTLIGSNFNDVLVGGSRLATPTTPGGDGTDSLTGGLGTE